MLSKINFLFLEGDDGPKLSLIYLKRREINFRIITLGPNREAQCQDIRYTAAIGERAEQT